MSDDGAQHPELERLQQWANDLLNAADLVAGNRRMRRKYLKAWHSLHGASAGAPTGTGDDCLNSLLAGGLVRYMESAHRIPDDVPSDVLALDLLLSVLWPTIIVPNLKPSWHGRVQSITSPHIASAVAHARISGNSTAAMQQILSLESSKRMEGDGDVNVVFGGDINGLLRHFDSKRGGHEALTAISAGKGIAPPAQGQGSRKLVKWIYRAGSVGLAGVGGIRYGADIEQKAVSLERKLLQWLEESSEASASYRTGPDLTTGAGSHPELYEGGAAQGHGNSPGQHSALIDKAVELFDSR